MRGSYSVAFGPTIFYSAFLLKFGDMSWRLQMQWLLCVIFLVTTVIMVVSAILPPVEAGGSTDSEQSNFSSKAKMPSNLTPSLDFDFPAPGSIETPWDAGSIWDEEAPDYDITQTVQ